METEGGATMEVEMKIRGLTMDPVSQMPIVVLKDVNGGTVLPISRATASSASTTV